MKYLHIEHTDGKYEHANVEYGEVAALDGVLRYSEKNNYREQPQLKRGWPLENIKRYWFSDRESG